MNQFRLALLWPENELGKRIKWAEVLPRGFALFLGCFSLLNVAGSFRAPGFDANLWWVDLRVLPPWLARLSLAGAGVLLAWFAIRPAQRGIRRVLTLVCLAGLCGATLMNAVVFYALLARGGIRTLVPVPLSLLLAGGLGAIWLAAARGQTGFGRSGGFFRVALVATACAVLFPLLQMFCFGKTDYRRPADAAIVLGARVYADGRPSDALADRVRTACQLYRAGLTRKIIVSGGPGDGTVHETESMRAMAIKLGVPANDILSDRAGLNTRATVRNTEPLLKQLNASRVLVVSHFYHLPRIKLAYQQDGWEVFTVPARESYILRQLPYNMLREIAAFWAYYLEPLKQVA